MWSLKIQQKQIQSPARGKEESSATAWARSSGVKNLELWVDSKLNTSQWHALAARRPTTAGAVVTGCLGLVF